MKSIQVPIKMVYTTEQQLVVVFFETRLLMLKFSKYLTVFFCQITDTKVQPSNGLLWPDYIIDAKVQQLSYSLLWPYYQC